MHPRVRAMRPPRRERAHPATVYCARRAYADHDLRRIDGSERQPTARERNAMTLTEQIKEYALELGFDLVRVTSADPFTAAETALKERIGAHLMDGLDWFTAARATVASNPRALLPEARSVIALGTFYLTDAPRDLTTPGDPHGRISAYAWGDDYHEVIRARLDR